jgi:hypothetical protein
VPRLASVSTGALLVTPLRAALAAAILGGAVAEGLPRTGVFLAVGVGGMLLVFGSASSRRLRSLGDLPAPPSSARFDHWWGSAARAALPSTIGLGVLGGIALGFSSGLAGVCGGLLGAMAILGLVSGILLLAEESREQRRLYVDWGILQPRRYAGRSS